MDSVTWHIVPSATLAYLQYAEAKSWVRAAPPWQDLSGLQIPERLLPTGCRQPTDLAPHHWVDFVMDQGLSAITAQTLQKIPDPVVAQIQNELALRASSLKHHWLTRGPGVQAWIEAMFPLSELMLVELYPVLPFACEQRSFAPVLAGSRTSMVLLPAGLYDTNPFAPELLKVVLAATHAALRIQPELLSDAIGSQRIQLAAALLATAIGRQVDLGQGDRDTFLTLLQHLPNPDCESADRLWRTMESSDDPKTLASACVDWLLDRHHYRQN